MNKKNIILTSSAWLVLASLLAWSFAFADSSTGAVENTLLNKNVKQNMQTWKWEKREIPAFIKNLPEATQEKLKTLQETHREEAKAIFDTYKDSEKTDAIQEEIDAKMEALQTKHKAELTTLLNWVDGAEDFIAKMWEGPKGMGKWPRNMDGEHFGKAQNQADDSAE